MIPRIDLPGPGARGDLVHALPAGRRPRPRPLDPRRRARRARSRRVSRDQRRDSSGSSRSSRRARSSMRPRSRRSTVSTSCSSARRTCRTASGSPGGSTIPSTSTRCSGWSPRPRPRARRPGSCCATRPACGAIWTWVPVHRARLRRRVRGRRRPGGGAGRAAPDTPAPEMVRYVAFRCGRSTSAVTRVIDGCDLRGPSGDRRARFDGVETVHRQRASVIFDVRGETDEAQAGTGDRAWARSRSRVSRRDLPSIDRRARRGRAT